MSKQQAEILKRAIILRDKLDKLVESAQQSANNAALAVVHLEATSPDYLGIPSTFTCDLVTMVASADRANAALEALVFSITD